MNPFGRGLNTNPVDPERLRLANEAMRGRMLLDTSPIGSVGAPSGVPYQPGAVDRRVDGKAVLALLSSPIPVLGDMVGLAADAHTFATEPESRTPLNFGLSALGLLPFVPAMTAYHGSPHLFDAFRWDDKVRGTGEGAQAFGDGMYFAQAKGAAMGYRNPGARISVGAGPKGYAQDAMFAVKMQGKEGDIGAARQLLRDKAAAAKYGDVRKEYLTAADNIDELSRINPEGHLYTVDIPDADIPRMLDWDTQIVDQPEHIRAALAPLIGDDKVMSYSTGGTLVHKLEAQMGKAKATQFLQELGIPGIRYLDGGSRGIGTGTSNFVVFDPTNVKILGRE